MASSNDNTAPRCRGHAVVGCPICWDTENGRWLVSQVAAADSRPDHAATPPESPEERLERLRFFTIEGDDNIKPRLAEWMQEVEIQVSGLRDWIATKANKGPIW